MEHVYIMCLGWNIYGETDHCQITVSFVIFAKLNNLEKYFLDKAVFYKIINFGWRLAIQCSIWGYCDKNLSDISNFDNDLLSCELRSKFIWNIILVGTCVWKNLICALSIMNPNVAPNNKNKNRVDLRNRKNWFFILTFYLTFVFKADLMRRQYNPASATIRYPNAWP